MDNGPVRAPRKPIMIIEWAHRRDVTRRRRGREAEREEREEKKDATRGRKRASRKWYPRGSAQTGRAEGARERREENRMARGGIRGRRWAFRGPAMITDPANP